LYKIPANTLFVGKNLIYVPVCHSTNTIALDLSQKAAPPEGTLVITDHQQAGRGQRGNGWEAEPHKNLHFSIILKPTFLAIADQFLLNQCISLAVVDCLDEQLSLDAKIKWPNDIFIDNKKVGGILIENSLSRDILQQSVIGIGLNVNQQQFEAVNAISLLLITKQYFSLTGMLEQLLEKIESRYLQLKRGERSTIERDYLQQLFRMNETHRYVADKIEFEGEIVGVDNRGRLIIKTRSEERYFDLKQVKFVI
jgi:BirA family biotin operon repressor/biotin-[acetyl-CoA-carboxylase] ligase